MQPLTGVAPSPKIRAIGGPWVNVMILTNTPAAASISTALGNGSGSSGTFRPQKWAHARQPRHNIVSKSEERGGACHDTAASPELLLLLNQSVVISLVDIKGKQPLIRGRWHDCTRSRHHSCVQPNAELSSGPNTHQSFVLAFVLLRLLQP